MTANDLKLHYIDDDADDLMLFEIASSGIGIKVNLYNSGKKLFQGGLDILRKVPSIVFVDLNMPAMTGYEVIAKLRASEHFQKLPIVILSTAGDLNTAEKCKAAGANYYIQKPTSAAKLQNAIEYVLAIDWDTFNPKIEEFVHKY